MVADFETVVTWFEKARDNAAQMGKHESALLWTDGMAHLVRTKNENIALAKRVEALESLLAAWAESEEYDHAAYDCYALDEAFEEAQKIATRRAGRAS